MQKYIKYKKEKTYVIDREDFHRHLRNAEAELNMPNDQRMCVQLVNSLYATALTASMAIAYLEQAKEGTKGTEDMVDECKYNLEQCEKTLLRWEKLLLDTSYKFV